MTETMAAATAGCGEVETICSQQHHKVNLWGTICGAFSVPYLETALMALPHDPWHNFTGGVHPGADGTTAQQMLPSRQLAADQLSPVDGNDEVNRQACSTNQSKSK